MADSTESSAARPVRVGIVSVSDRAYRGIYEDRGGPAVRAYLDDVLATPWVAVARVIPDEVDVIRDTLVELVDDARCCLVITTGGTGPAPRDVTPEATAAVLDKELDGFGEAMRAVSRPNVPTAILSRQTAGVRGSALIVNLPGSPKAVRECLDAVFAAVPDCVDLIGGPRLDTDPSRVKAHRPH
ncbi:MAG: molybdopterin adenylyltransferase [Gemmatimonadetes bacterium]|nr:molybdopterin adenylyltransferase [Gemmatimonadota bacterium]MXX34913.1 molybdopterin adenylyltransferase [Gemmatimonadota bacterium]MYD13398.1 molybdopterin adenylyltransferase [Gemmatimonadota bacterium]MYI66763.1 molybdopterin adenylyltransferase [Gemmatimonadota bacterium]